MPAIALVVLLALAGLWFYGRQVSRLAPLDASDLKFGWGDLLLAAVLGSMFAANGIALLGRSAVITRQVIIVGSVYSLCVALIVISALVLGRRNPIHVFGLRWRDWPRGLGLTAVALLAVYPLIVLSLLLAGSILGPHAAPQDMILYLQKTTDLHDRLTFIVMAVIIAPVTEEILFRGYIQRVFHRYAGRWVGILASAALFALSHGHLTVLAGLFLLAIALSIIYDRVKSLWAPILLHAVFNSISVAVALAWPNLKI